VTRALRASPIILLLALVMTGAPARGQDGDREPPLTVSCYDPERRIVQTVRSHECRGRIVDPEEAARISRRLRLERARQVGKTAGEGSDTPAPRAGRSFGSGFAVTDRGHVLTAWHVIEGCATVDLATASGLRQPAEVLDISPDADIALLRTPLPVRPFLIPTAPPDTETPLKAMGYPNLGLPVIRPMALDMRFMGVSDREDTGRLLVFAGPIRAGASGGPLVDATGRARGLIVSKVHTPEIFRATGNMVKDVNFAIGGAELAAWLKRIGIQAAPPDTPDTARHDPSSRERDVLRVICHPPDAPPDVTGR